MAGKLGKGGQKGRSGRKSKAEEMGLQQLLDECWTLDERKECVRKLSVRASKGDLESIKLLLAYTYGKPVDRKEITGPDGGAVPIRIIEVRGPQEQKQ